ncbi:pyridoxamine 5'-phosphate oxidase family protein [Peptostreptococcus porci]|uniref:pyridoxamine 5'-phosphate oxidase family protein n=1 Tax=Peptostreptococcus porci TaxID=2652282 RepID=UPI0023F418B8|nr:pyridoxamine 5'-phosphate oxidase family protein [Peptostreptococcus porci]MDD7182720.1 pyridoxamine 5'-phosphate oxidase family protein [Peptostreptococcus porci]MDY2794725.1 pyridoxamine 5'-phosphate oxidase family protein [Peptostreptococcus porci]MDY5964895.1 pyridoxamine 5'-phosphate oxidase family protein [Peptostreptococcus porci]MDY6231758.1 pyridoxamine 5'-phosphate oxidase family protein [Peptostreptococcus porci]
MLSEKFFEVLKYEGVVSIVSWGSTEEANITNTWNSYLVVKGDRILLPAAGMNSTESDVKVNNKVKVTLGARDVEGFNGYQGTGFLINGTARFIEDGDEFDMMKEKFPFLRKVLEIKVDSSKQLL